MRRGILVLFLFLLPGVVYGGEVSDRIADCWTVYNEGSALIASYFSDKSQYPHMTDSDIVLVAGIVNQASNFIDTFQRGFGGVEQPGNPTFDNWVTYQLNPFFSPGGYVETLHNFLNPSPPSGDMPLPVELLDFDYGGIVLTLLGYLCVVLLCAIGVGFSVWGVSFVFRLFKGLVR